MENVPGTFLLSYSEVQLSVPICLSPALHPICLSPAQAGRKVPASFFFLPLKEVTGVCS